MANYLTANIAKAQGKLTMMFKNGEVRYRTPVTWLEFVKNRSVIFPDHKVLRTHDSRTIETHYFLRKSRSLGTSGYIHNHTGTKGDSGTLNPSWTTYDDKFYYSLKQANANIYSKDEMLINELRDVSTNFAEGMETVAATYLFNNRSQVNNATTNDEGGFDNVTYVYEIETDKEKRAIQICKTVMDVNKWQGNYVIFCDSISFNKFEFYANQGGANSENLMFQFSGCMFVKSIDLDALASAFGYTGGFWITIEPGTIGVLDWIPSQNRNGDVTTENKYGTFINPIDGLIYGTHEYSARADESSNGGKKQDVKTEVQVFCDFALEHAPLSTSNETPIQAFGLVEAIVA